MENGSQILHTIHENGRLASIFECQGPIHRLLTYIREHRQPIFQSAFAIRTFIFPSYDLFSSIFLVFYLPLVVVRNGIKTTACQ